MTTELKDVLQYKNSKGLFLFAEVPKGAHDCCTVGVRYHNFQAWYPDCGMAPFFIGLPVDACRFLFTTESATEENAGRVAEYVQGYGYSDYTNPYNGGSSPFDVWASAPFKQPLESLATLLKSLKLDTEKNYAVLESGQAIEK